MAISGRSEKKWGKQEQTVRGGNKQEKTGRNPKS